MWQHKGGYCKQLHQNNLCGEHNVKDLNILTLCENTLMCVWCLSNAILFSSSFAEYISAVGLILLISIEVAKRSRYLWPPPWSCPGFFVYPPPPPPPLFFFCFGLDTAFRICNLSATSLQCTWGNIKTFRGLQLHRDRVFLLWCSRLCASLWSMDILACGFFFKKISWRSLLFVLYRVHMLFDDYSLFRSSSCHSLVAGWCTAK